MGARHAANGPPGMDGAHGRGGSVRALMGRLTGPEQRFWLLVVAVGLIAGLGAVALLKVLRFTQQLFWRSAGEDFLAGVAAAPTWRRVLIPILGGALVTLLTLIVGRPMRGHGTAGIIESIWVKSGRLSLPRALLRGLVSILAVAMGAPLGREGALLSTGAASGSSLARWLRLGPGQARLLVACGASAGMASAYNVPIGAALFGLEVLLGSFALELFGPIVVSCVVATLVSRGLIADHPSFVIPHYTLLHPRELVLAMLLGVVLGVASAFYVRGINVMSDLLDRAAAWLAPFLPLMSMTVVGVTAVWLPQLLGNGYDAVNGALLGKLSLAHLLLLPLAKLALTATCAGAGVPGGLFTPSLFYGGLLGGAFGMLAEWVLPGGAPSGAYALLGMGAVLAGTTHASVSAVLLIFELTGDYPLVLPLMLSAVVSAVVSQRLEPESLYTSVLNRRNVRVPATVPHWLRQEGARALLKPVHQRVPPSAPLQQVLAFLLEQPLGQDLYVTDEAGRYRGALVLDQLKGHLPDHSQLHATIAADVMDMRVRPITPGLSLSEVAVRFTETSLERLPVVDGERRLLGTISKQDVLKQGTF
ncbi:voltage-gated chloride channel [Myxococcus xanthus DK 1622]|uniref:Voltage-gated chloride channel n=2 Tax=Myxococcaceae TaxID=31 RepID=Q1CVK4_MYXXD|nr:chloride channel protein [Myxococcus xanthus]ABF92339.1 voltage-gated chloride channel [Myxococcus xanthus DK 1622]NOJ56971.1 CBS domain-containing protein [Myxococcus xanthus]QPM79689.1 chloride channel protein [Myxococcus xanthus]QVW68769.1 chloride channel protein [Myxococcus xanthus DZ2]UEO05118.1 chloride channel protein [Myxococcus xanthus DZ2]